MKIKKVMTKISNKKMVLFSTAISVLLMLVAAFAFLFNQRKFSNVQENFDPHYCYQMFNNNLNPVLIIHSLKYSEEYIKYYESVEEGNNPVIRFPIKVLSPEQEVYPIQVYKKDERLVKIIFLNKGKMDKAYVYVNNLHLKKPEYKTPD